MGRRKFRSVEKSISVHCSFMFFIENILISLVNMRINIL